MVFILKPGVNEAAKQAFLSCFEEQGFSTILSEGTEHTAVCLIGNTAAVDMEHIVATTSIVAYGKRVTEQYKAVNRSIHPEDTKIQVGDAVFGPDSFTVISGPCSVESEEQIIKVAKAIQQSGAKMLRGGAFKPRTSPYAYQGLKEDGLRLLSLAKKETGLPVVSEIMNQTQIPLFEDVDVIQIGARNMQNFDLLREVGLLQKPILLKRGLANTIEELLLSAEYILSAGNSNVILCERGIRTFETMTRNTLDLSAVVVLKQKSHLPVIVDPSHAAGISSFVTPLSKAALAVGADGVMVETHNEPSKALCDGAQSLDLEQFDSLMKELRRRVQLENRVI
jgi:3-deoxy-7-phosphoheptulonate synthase